MVTDGVTVGRPCCSVHDCKESLASVKHHYCPRHTSLNDICVVEKCAAKANEGFQTCTKPTHRQVETYYRDQGKAMFQLKKRLERLQVSQTHDSIATEPNLTGEHDTLEGFGADEEVISIDDGEACNGKSDAGNRKVRARFGRRRTHNEELCVASCGIILGRATFYGSEAPNGVRVCNLGYSYMMVF